MAKKSTKKEETLNHDEVITSVAQSSPESVSIKSMIRLIRGQQVMLEFDFLKSQFAMSNITDSQDIKNLKSQIAISRWGGTRRPPYAFTRNGVAASPETILEMVK